MKHNTDLDLHSRLAEFVRSNCIKAALQGYENATVSGLCHEGAWEAAIGAMQMLDIGELIEAFPEN